MKSFLSTESTVRHIDSQGARHRLSEENLEITSSQASHPNSTREKDEEETDAGEHAWKCTSRHLAEPRTLSVLDVDHHIIVTYNVLLPSHIQG